MLSIKTELFTSYTSRIYSARIARTIPNGILLGISRIRAAKTAAKCKQLGEKQMNNFDELLSRALNKQSAPLSSFERSLANVIERLRAAKLPKNISAEQRINKAIAQQLSTARFTGKVKAQASKHLLQDELDLVLLPLDVANGNNQAVPASEAQNILATALYMPVRANFDGSLNGHTGAREVGTITSVKQDGNVIRATAVLWNEQNDELVEHLRANDGEIGGSFELYYGRTELRDKTVYLYDTVFAAHALVDNPAYGKNTPVRIK